MAESSGFFEAKWDDTIDNGDRTFGNWDRRYLADNFADYFKNFIGNGVFVSPTNQLKVSTSSGMNVQVSTGWAFIKGYWYHNDENKIITIPSNTGSTSRTDTIKARLNLNTRVITVDLYVNNNSVVRNDTYYDMILAQIVVPAYATTIPAANITDKRPDEAVCGFVKGLVEVITTDDLFDQFQAIFDEWFDGVKDQVTGDLAIRLQLEFTQLNTNVDTYYQNTNNNIAAYKSQMQNIVDTYQAAVEQQVDAAEDLVDGYVYNDYITDELAFTFVNNVCEISDSRVTPNSLLDLYFTKETIDEAENCQINIESGVQKYIITCVKTPSMSLRGRIRVRVNSATPVVPPELDEFATKSWVSSNFTSQDEVDALDNEIEWQKSQGYLQKNLLDYNNLGHYTRDTSTGEINGSGSTTSSTIELVEIKPSTKYIISWNGTATYNRIFYYNSNKQYIGNEVLGTYFTTPNNCKYIAFQTVSASGSLYGFQMEEGSSITEYTPYGVPNIKAASKMEVVTNLLKFEVSTNVLKGITLTNNGDGTYTLNGTNDGTGDSTFDVQCNISPGIYRLLGCPKGGSSSTYSITRYTSSWANTTVDYGEGARFINQTQDANRFRIVVKSGATVNNLVFKPMVTNDLEATYNDFVSYTGDKTRLNECVSELSRVKDITNEFTFSTDCTWGTAGWNKICKCGNIIKVNLRFTTPSTVSDNKAIMTIPSKYAPYYTHGFLCNLVNQWDGSSKGVLNFINSQPCLASTAWTANANVVVTFEYLIKEG